jgi:hypothetical protein
MIVSVIRKKSVSKSMHCTEFLDEIGSAKDGIVNDEGTRQWLASCIAISPVLRGQYIRLAVFCLSSINQIASFSLWIPEKELQFPLLFYSRKSSAPLIIFENILYQEISVLTQRPGIHNSISTFRSTAIGDLCRKIRSLNQK